jgi:hypothetical protein
MNIHLTYIAGDKIAVVDALTVGNRGDLASRKRISGGSIIAGFGGQGRGGNNRELRGKVAILSNGCNA